jgi:hypothetical protein
MKSTHMKSIVIFCFLVIGLFTAANAQFAIRPYAGVNSSTLTKNIQDSEWQSKLGYQAGVDFMLGNKVYLLSGLQWEMLNSELSPTNPTIGDLTKFTSSHIKIPVWVGIRLLDVTKSNLFNVRMFTGPDVSFLIDAKEGTFGSIRFNKNSLANASYGYTLGGGIDIGFVFVDAGYRWGVSRFFDETLINNGSRSNVFFANAGLRFSF